MKITIFIFFAVALTVYYVDGLYSQKCKDAETSNDKLVRFIENANCTLVEKNRLFRQGLNQLQSKFQQGFAHLHNKFNVIPSTPSLNPINPSTVKPVLKLDPPVSTDPSSPSYPTNPTNRPTYSTSHPTYPTYPTYPTDPTHPVDNDRLVNENLTLTGYEGLDHPIDVRMLLDDDAPPVNSQKSLRGKRDAGDSDDQSEDKGTV